MSATIPFEIAVETLKEYRDQGVEHIVLDVREPGETATHGFEGAVEIPMGDVPSRVADLPSDGVIVVMCHLGGRSMQVTGWLRQQGFDNVTNLRGGIEAWSQA